MLKRMAFGFFTLFFSLLFISEAQKSRTYHFGPDISTLIGTLKQKIFYGPPNFGENPKTDLKDTVWVLVLDKPIAVVPAIGDEENESEDNVEEIQIFPDLDLMLLRGKEVVLVGKMRCQILPRDYTKVIIQVDDPSRIIKK